MRSKHTVANVSRANLLAHSIRQSVVWFNYSFGLEILTRQVDSQKVTLLQYMKIFFEIIFFDKRKVFFVFFIFILLEILTSSQFLVLLSQKKHVPYVYLYLSRLNFFCHCKMFYIEFVYVQSIPCTFMPPFCISVFHNYEQFSVTVRVLC